MNKRKKATVQVRCIKPFGNAKVGDTAEVPDGAAVDPGHWEVVQPPSLPPEVTADAVAAISGLAGRVTPKEGM